MRRSLLTLCLAAVGVAFVGSGLTPAMAVVLGIGDGTMNTTAPADNPDWANMARVANASGIYLGDGWMLTANHVLSSTPNPTVTFTDGRVFNSVPGSEIQLSNPFTAPTNAADLAMFRLAADPGLPALSIVTATPAASTGVMMIGAGLSRETNLIGWSVSSTFVWTQTPLPFANARGYALDTTISSQMRWGVSPVASGGSTISTSADGTTSTASFTTNFASTGSPYSAIAAVGDSGGGVFQFIGGHWQLAGVMDAIAPPTVSGQPSNTVVYGNNQTLSADLSQYRDEIAQILALPQPSLLATAMSEPASWRNQVNPYDVARTGSVNAHDVLLLINGLENGKGGPLSGSPTASDPLVDVNGDGVFDIQDVSQLINFLLNNGANPTASASSVTSQIVALVPEPSTAVLSLLGLLLVCLARRMRVARRCAER